MNKIIILLVALSTLMSCSNDKQTETPNQGPLIITKADYLTNYKVNGTTYGFFQTTNNAIAIPTSGENQTWDFSTLTETSTLITGGTNYLTPTNSAFSSATYSSIGTNAWTISGISSPEFDADYFYELNDNGIYNLGYSQNEAAAITVASLGATINYPIQNLNYTGTTKYPFVQFPAKFGNAPVTTSGIIRTSNYTVTAPAFGLNNTPAQTKVTSSLNQEIIGSGNANLKGIGNKRVLVLKSSYSDQSNYFLGGAPAPAALLSNLGITDGTIITGTSYRFIAEGLGSVGVIDVNASGVITSATFRKEL